MPLLWLGAWLFPIAWWGSQRHELGSKRVIKSKVCKCRTWHLRKNYLEVTYGFPSCFSQHSLLHCYRPSHSRNRMCRRQNKVNHGFFNS
jgi:hypothetical protein